MKSLEELHAKRIEIRAKMGIGADNTGKVKVLVGLATCGIAAGAGPIMDALKEAVKEKGLDNVTVTRTGCIGVCQYEPVVEVYKDNDEKVTYVKMTPEKMMEVLDKHIIGGAPVVEYTIGANVQ